MVGLADRLIISPKPRARVNGNYIPRAFYARVVPPFETPKREKRPERPREANRARLNRLAPRQHVIDARNAAGREQVLERVSAQRVCANAKDFFVIQLGDF